MYKKISLGVEVAAWQCLTHIKVNTARFKQNTAFGSTDNDKIREQMASAGPDGLAGWDSQWPATLLQPTIFPFIDVETREPLDEYQLFQETCDTRARIYKELQVDKATEDKLVGFRHLYCDENGELKLPTFGEHYWVLSGNQRFVNAIVPAAGLALKRGVDFKQTVPSIIIESDSMSEIQEEQLRGNQHALAQNRMGKLDMLVPAINFVRQGMNEQRFSELVGAERIKKDDLDANNPKSKIPDKAIGRFVYKLAQVVNWGLNNGVNMMAFLVERVASNDLKEEMIPVERLKMTGGGSFDLAQIYRCLVPATDKANGLDLYLSKYKEGKSENLTEMERDAMVNGPWDAVKFLDWVNSIKVGGSAKPPKVNTSKPNGMTADDAAGKVRPLGSQVLEGYISDIINEKVNTDPLNVMSNIGALIDKLPPFVRVNGGQKFLIELSHYLEQLDASEIAQGAAVVAKLKEVLDHAIETHVKGKAKAKPSDTETDESSDSEPAAATGKGKGKGKGKQS